MDNTSNQVTTKKLKSLTILKILYIIGYILVTGFLIWGFIDSLTSNNPSLSMGLYVALIVIIMGSIGYIICMIFSIIGFIVSLVKKSNRNAIVFTIFTLLPIITEAIIIIIATNLNL